MNKKLFTVFIIMALIIGACSFITINPNGIVGSGKVISETRSVSGFTSISLEGSANVEVNFGSADSVIVSADDNILPLIQTVVQNGKLVISTKPNTNLTVVSPVRVNVTMKSLKAASLNGSGNITITGLDADNLAVDMLGSGNITATGTVNSIKINLPGSGNVYCNGLKAKDAIVTLGGSGNIEVFASQTLDANLFGSGTIRYSGNPSQVNKSVSGSGSITP